MTTRRTRTRIVASAIAVLAVLAVLALGAPARASAAQRVPAAGEAPAFARYPIDQAELDGLAPRHPHVVELVTRGETLAIAGDMARALVMFEQAAGEYPYSELLSRRRCEALTALGRREEAVAACREAMQRAPVPPNVRATVQALLSGAAALSADDLAQALQLAGIERRQRPDEPWGYAALCDVGARIGDEVMLEYCAQELLRVAPGDPTTRRVLATLRPPWWTAAAWLVIGLASSGTLVHALWQLARGRRRPARVGAALGLALLGGVFSTSPARADDAPQAGPPDRPAVAPPAHKDPSDLGQWSVDDQSPESSIPGEGARNRDPIQFGYWLQDVSARALEASQQGDHRTAIKYFNALAKAVPDRSIAFSKLCGEYDAIGERDNALPFCAVALTREGVVLRDYGRFVYVVLEKPGALDHQEIAAVSEAIAHVREDPNGGDAAAREMECDLAVKTRDASRLEQCTTALAATSPDSPKTLTYAWALAMVRGRYDDAHRAIDRARTSSMKPEGLEGMERETARAESRRRTIYSLGGLAFALLVAGAAIAMRRRSGMPAPAPQAS